MTLTLHLTEEETRWVESRPDGGERAIRNIIRAQMRHEDDLAKRHGPEAAARVRRALREGNRLKASDKSRKDIGEELIAALDAIDE